MEYKWSINGVITKVAWNFSVVCSLSQDAKCIGVGPGQRFKGGSEVYPTRWTWVWVNSGSWWWTGRPGVLQSVGNWTELNWGIYSILRSKIAGLKDMCSCVWLNYVLTDYFLKFWFFFNVLSHRTHMFHCWTCLQILVLRDLIFASLGGVQWYLIVVLIWISLMTWEIVFHMLIYYSFVFSVTYLLVQISIVSVKHSL